MNPENIYRGDRRGTFYIGVAPDNVSDMTYSSLKTAKEQAKDWSEETGIVFHVYEQVTVYRPVF